MAPCETNLYEILCRRILPLVVGYEEGAVVQESKAYLDIDFLCLIKIVLFKTIRTMTSR